MEKFSLKTQRLGFRPLKSSDIDYLEALDGDPKARRYFPTGAQTREQTIARIQQFLTYEKEKGLPSFVIFELESGEFVGRAGFGPLDSGEIEIGYILDKKFWGKGYASEALHALLDWAKKHIKADYIVAYAVEDNIASFRVMEKGGMEFYKHDIVKDVPSKFYRVKNS